MIDHKKIHTWLQAYGEGFGLAGVADDGEVFIATPTGLEKDGDLIRAFRAEFPDIGKMTLVVKPSLDSLLDVVDYLNQVIAQASPAKKKNLLNIGEFDG